MTLLLSCQAGTEQIILASLAGVNSPVLCAYHLVGGSVGKVREGALGSGPPEFSPFLGLHSEAPLLKIKIKRSALHCET